MRARLCRELRRNLLPGLPQHDVHISDAAGKRGSVSVRCRHAQARYRMRSLLTSGVYPAASIEERLRLMSRRYAQAKVGGGQGS